MTNVVGVPAGAVKSFGPYGPEYEVLHEAAVEDWRRMAHIIVVRTGEELDYPLDDILTDPGA
jgi:hypothetical protein